MKMHTVREYIEKNDDTDIRLDAMESRDDCDPLSHTFWQGRLKAIPEMFRDFEVVTEGWCIGAEINCLSVYAPEFMGIRSEDFEHTLVFGTKRTEEAGGILFRGTMKECYEFAINLNQDDFYNLYVCREDGLILFRIIEPKQVTFRRVGRK